MSLFSILKEWNGRGEKYDVMTFHGLTVEEELNDGSVVILTQTARPTEETESRWGEEKKVLCLFR